MDAKFPYCLVKPWLLFQVYLFTFRPLSLGGGGEEQHSIPVSTLNRQTMKPRVF